MANPRNYSNIAQATSLSSTIVAGDVTVAVVSQTGWPAPPFTIAFERGTPNEEAGLVTAVAGTTLTVTRGFDNTTAKGHGAGTPVEHTTSAIDFRKAGIVPHTFAVAGAIAVPSGDTNFIPPMQAIIDGTYTMAASLYGVAYRLNNGAAGTTVSFKVQRNGADITGFGTTASPLITPNSTAWSRTLPTPVALTDADSLAPVVTAIAGSPQNLSIALLVLYYWGT